MMHDREGIVQAFDVKGDSELLGGGGVMVL